MPPVTCDNAIFFFSVVSCYCFSAASDSVLVGKRGRPSDHDDRKKQQSPQGNKGDSFFFFFFFFSRITEDMERIIFPSLCFPRL